MAAFNICPVCGNRTMRETKTNAAGDTLARWYCNVAGDYASEWDLTVIAPGPDTPDSGLLGESSTATEATVANMVDTTRRRLDDLLSRVGPVTEGNSLVEIMQRVYSAVDTLEISSDSIALNADAINLNTDTMEALTASTNDRIGTVNDPDTAGTLIGRLKSIRALIAAAEAARDLDASTAQARLDLLATEASLLSARDTITAKNEQMRALLAAQPTLTDLQTQRQVSEPITARMARNGRAYMSSTNRISLSLAGNLRATLTNPSASTRRLFIHRVTGATSAGPAWSTLISNPTTGLPTQTKTIVNTLLGGSPSSAILAADVHTTEQLGNGTPTGLVYALFTGRTVVDIPTPIIINPGTTLGFNVPFAGAADAALTVYWWEEDI